MSDAIMRSLDRARDFLAAIPGATEKATARALTRAAKAGREAGIDAIGERYAVQLGDVRERVTDRAATADRLEAIVMARSGPLPLTYFPHTPTQPGTGGRGMPLLRAEIIRGQEREIPGAFVAPIGGRARVMVRTGERTRTGRAAIKSLSAVPIAVMLRSESVRAAVDAAAFATVDKTLDREIDAALERAS